MAPSALAWKWRFAAHTCLSVRDRHLRMISASRVVRSSMDKKSKYSARRVWPCLFTIRMNFSVIVVAGGVNPARARHAGCLADGECTEVVQRQSLVGIRGKFWSLVG